MSALAVSKLTVAYGKTVVLTDVDLTVADGQVVCLIGANGAGKTTIMRAISGLLPPRSGCIEFNRQDITGRPAHAIAKLGLIHVPEGRQIFTELTVAENLRVGAHLLRDGREFARRYDAVLARFPRLDERSGQLAGSMSGGEQQMLALGRALMADPTLLLLDEPSLGLAPLFVEEIFRIISDLKREGRTILVVEQNASAALEVADYAYVMENGRISLHGAAHDMANDPGVVASYLGG